MIALDTGICVPESRQTLLMQQRQLEDGKRDVQMFPAGTPELPLPNGFYRFENERGVFHFDGKRFTPEMIDWASSKGRENEFLNLGPYSKYDVAVRVKRGEKLTCITEYLDGVELRSACGTDGTLPEQLAYFERTKEPEGVIIVGSFPPRVEGAKWP